MASSVQATELKLGDYLREKRIAKGMSIRQVALYAGCSDSFLGMIERGVRQKPSPLILRKLAKPLSVPYEMLLHVAGYGSDTIEELKPKTLIQALRESIGMDKEEFAIYPEMSLQELEVLEGPDVSVESMEVVFEKIFSPRRSLTAHQKLLIRDVENLWCNSDSKYSQVVERGLGALLESIVAAKSPRLQIKARIPELAYKRITSGYSQRELARRTELSSCFISQLESGKRHTGPDAANRICLELQAKFNELFAIVDRAERFVPK